MTFQASEYKEKYFLDLNDNKNLPAKPMYTKDGTWLNLLRYSNTLYARVTRAITNPCSYRQILSKIFSKIILCLFLWRISNQI